MRLRARVTAPPSKARAADRRGNKRQADTGVWKAASVARSSGRNLIRVVACGQKLLVRGLDQLEVIATLFLDSQYVNQAVGKVDVWHHCLCCSNHGTASNASQHHPLEAYGLRAQVASTV